MEVGKCDAWRMWCWDGEADAVPSSRLTVLTFVHGLVVGRIPPVLHVGIQGPVVQIVRCTVVEHPASTLWCLEFGC